MRETVTELATTAKLPIASTELKAYATRHTRHTRHTTNGRTHDAPGIHACVRRGLKKPIEEWTATGHLVSTLLVAACDTAVPTEILKLLLAARPPDDFSCLHPPGYADMDNGTATVRSQPLSPPLPPIRFIV